MSREIHYEMVSFSHMLAESWLTNIYWLPNGFNRPWVLWLMVIPMLLIAWIWTRRSLGVALPVDHSHHGSGHITRTLINMAESVAPILLGVIIWILSGPVILGKPIEKRSITNIQFCVDISGSMMAPFGSGTRYDASMQAINDFLDFREGDAFGLSFFGNTVLHWCPLTTDASAIRCSPPFMRPGRVPPWFGGTEIGKALLACRQKLMEQAEGDRMIILVSDGSSSDLFGGNDADIARRCFEQGIRVFAIHIAENEPPAPIVTITSMTGGEVFNPGDPESLAGVFRQIDDMQKSEVEQTIAEQLDHFLPYCLIGLVLLSVMLVASFGLRYTPW